MKIIHINKRLKSLALLFTLAISPFYALADFDLPGKGILKYPTGMNKDFNFGFAYKEGPEGYYFRVGKQKMNTSELPKKYSIWLTLHEESGNVFIQEFAKGYFKGFEWDLGDHKVKLHKKVFKGRRVKSDYVLTINGEDFYFAKKNAQLNINFNNKGVRSIDTDGFVRDRSFSQN